LRGQQRFVAFDAAAGAIHCKSGKRQKPLGGWMRRIGAMALGMAIALCVTAAGAQDYPNRPIKFVQGFPAGGNADAITRVLGAEMAKGLGQPVVSEARVGAGGNIAAEQIARGAPDGYTLLLATTAHVVSPALYASLNYDPVNDFAFISSITNVPFFIVTYADSPYKTLKDLVDAARARPGAINIGTAGIGTGQHMCLELFASTLGVKIQHVPFRGDAGAVTGLLGKNVEAIIAPATAVLGNVQGGNFRALAITAKERWPALKDVPTVAEAVSPNFEMIAWIGVAAAHGTPKPIVERLNREFRRVIALPNVDEQLRNLGGFPNSSSPEEATERVKFEIARWKDVAHKAGIVPR
jgi:tripartite-type tricarboxylate transporter receptor subunit TctC